MQLIACRLTDGQNLLEELEKLFLARGLSSAVVISSVGGLRHCEVRMPGAVGHISTDTHDIREYEGEYEIVSINGTIAQGSKFHLHVAFSDKEGNVFGGHLKSLTVRNSTEIVLATDPKLAFSREVDQKTGFEELVVSEED